jgi:hypothetical protein
MKVGDLVKWSKSMNHHPKPPTLFLIIEVLDGAGEQEFPGEKWYRLMGREGLVWAEDLEVVSESR